MFQGATGQPRAFIYANKVYIFSSQMDSARDVVEALYGEALKPMLKQVSALRR